MSDIYLGDAWMIHVSASVSLELCWESPFHAKSISCVFRYWNSEVSETQRAKLFCSHSPVDGSATGSPRGRTASCSNGAFGLKRNHVTEDISCWRGDCFHLIQIHNLSQSLWDWFIAMVKKCQDCSGNLGNLEIRQYFQILFTIHCQRSLV